MEILLGIIVILLVISNVYLMIAMQRQNRKPEINPQIEEIRREVVGLQRMFTGVKTRGIWGEWQLGSILDETLTPDQYETECMVIPGKTTRVEYAVKLPGRYEEPVYLPIDSKFPLDAYLQYEEALQSGNREMAEDAAIVFKNRVKCERYPRQVYSAAVYDRFCRVVFSDRGDLCGVGKTWAGAGIDAALQGDDGFAGKYRSAVK